MNRPQPHRTLPLVVLALLALLLGGVAPGCRDAPPDDEAPPEHAPAATAPAPAPPGAAARTRAADAAAIRQVFAAYTEATRARDGEAAVALVSHNTIARYEALRALAVEAAREREGMREAIRARSLGDRLLMVQMLAILGPDHLRSMTGRDVLVFGIDEGLFGAKTFASVSPVEPSFVNDALATAPVLGADGQPTAASWRFLYEDGGWRLDLTAAMDHADAQMRNEARSRGLSDEDYLGQVLEALPPVAPRDPWRTVRSEAGGFSVALPGVPQPRVEPAAGAQGEVHLLVARSVTGVVCFAGHSVVAQVPQEDAGVEVLLRGAAQGFAQRLGAEIAEAVLVEAGEGRRELRVRLALTGERSGDRGAALFTLVGDRLVELLVVGPGAAPASVMERCLGSLRVGGVENDEGQ